MVVIAIQRTKNGQLASADGAALVVTDAFGNTVVPFIGLNPISTGSYSYDALNLTPGRYTAIWTFLNTGYPNDVITRVFNLDAPVATTSGVTLMDIERATARQLGPYERFMAGANSNLNQFHSRSLVSSLALGGYEDQYMLRRGLSWTNALIASFVEDDRVRIVTGYDPANGKLSNDRQWALTPSVTPAEAVEIHYLNPEQELRPCVLDGLRRCFFWDTVTLSVSTTDLASGINLTASVPWLTFPAQLGPIYYGYPSQQGLPARVPWSQPYRSGQSLYLRTRGIGYGTLFVTALRPANSLVNGDLSLTGPNDDLDVLAVDLDYAVASCVVAAWKNIPERIQPLTASDIRITLKEAAAEFSKKSLLVAQAVPDAPALSLNYGSRFGDTVIGNLAEPNL